MIPGKNPLADLIAKSAVPRQKAASAFAGATADKEKSTIAAEAVETQGKIETLRKELRKHFWKK